MLKKINIGGMIKWGLIGLLAGAFISFFMFLITLLQGEGYCREFFIFLFSQGKEGTFWDLEFWGFVIILTLIFAFKGAMSKPSGGPREKEGIQAVSDQGLSFIERIVAWIASIVLTPIIAGPIMYYMWQNKYPEKAKQANDISIIVFLLELMILFIAIFAS